MNSTKLYGYLVVTNVCRKQIYEYKKIFAKSINLNQVDKQRWKLSFRKYNQQLYKLSFYFDGILEGYWYILPVKHPKLSIDMLTNINEESEKLLKEEWFYGVKDKAGLASLLGQIDNSFFNITPYPTILYKATYLWYTISTKQMFNNGNKRTALLTALLYLKLNGYLFDILDEVALYDISIKVANKEISFKQLYQYISRHSYIDFKFSRRILLGENS